MSVRSSAVWCNEMKVRSKIVYSGSNHVFTVEHHDILCQNCTVLYCTLVSISMSVSLSLLPSHNIITLIRLLLLPLLWLLLSQSFLLWLKYCEYCIVLQLLIRLTFCWQYYTEYITVPYMSSLDYAMAAIPSLNCCFGQRSSFVTDPTPIPSQGRPLWTATTTVYTTAQCHSTP